MNQIEELILFSEAVYQLKKYTDSNPDVGMGPSVETLIEKISFNTKHFLCEEDQDKVAILISLREIMKPPIFNWLHEYNHSMGNFPVSLLKSEEGRKKLRCMCYDLSSGQPY